MNALTYQTSDGKRAPAPTLGHVLHIDGELHGKAPL